MKIREVHQIEDVRMRNLLKEMRQAILDLHGTIEPMGTPTNVQVTPVAGGNKVRFTRSNGDGYAIVISKTASISDGYTVRIGDTTEYNDNIGKGGEKRYYWVFAYSNKGKADSKPTDVLSATSLAQGTDTNVPDGPPEYDPYRNYFQSKFDF